jgi:hypothetical protein
MEGESNGEVNEVTDQIISISPFRSAYSSLANSKVAKFTPPYNDS